MATDFSDALNAAKGNPGHPLRVKAILEECGAAKKDVLMALHDLSIPPAQIARALTSMGYEVSEGAVRNWRRKHV